MSCNDWERGTIILPSAAVAPLKKALREHINDLHEKTRAEAVRRHKAANTRSVDEYAKRLGINNYGGFDNRASVLDATVYAVLEGIWRAAKEGRKALHVPTVADVSRIVPKMKNGDTTFPVIGNFGFEVASISFHGREVCWSVAEGNRAVECAHDAPLAQMFFQRIERIKWTRGTGGYGVGNDEYNQDVEYPGGGANYTTFSYGPIGEAQKAADYGLTLAQYRKATSRTRSAW